MCLAFPCAGVSHQRRMIGAHGGCETSTAVDIPVMADLPGDIERLHDRWRQGDRDDLGLFEAVRDLMRRRAASGIRKITGGRANDQDVDEALFGAFKQLLAQDPSQITTLTGLAGTIAYRRGLDVGKALNRAREFPGGELLVDSADPAAPLPEDYILDAEDAAEREHLVRLVMECIESLPPGQSEVIRATILRDQELSDWAAEQGKSYEAARKQRIKGLSALRACVESKKDTTMEGGDHVG